MIESKLTHHLLSLCPADSDGATINHPFILAAGRGNIAPDRLEAWLAQDRHYALRGYVPLVGSMLARVPLPVSVGNSKSLGPQTDESKRYLRTITFLGEAITNVVREINFFEKTAEEAGFDLTVGPIRSSAGASDASRQGQQQHMANATWPLAPECEAYLNYMSRIAHTGTFLEQLTLLWAMEILYYRAWSSAAGARKATTFNTSGSSTSSAASSSGRSDGSSQPGGSTPLDSAQSEALRNLINNWSSDDFGAFVEELGNLLDFYGGASDFTKLDEATLAKVQSVWRTTVALERGFWEAGRGALK